MSWMNVLKSGVPCLECGKVYSLDEFRANEDKWTKFVDEDGMEFDICPKCSAKSVLVGGAVTQQPMNIKDKEKLQ